MTGDGCSRLPIAEVILAAQSKFRSLHPEQFQDYEFLTVEGVARLLHCSIDQARRISRKELPAYNGPGRRLLYFREDILRYIRRRPVDRRQIGTARRANDDPANDEFATSFKPAEVAKRLRSQMKGAG